MTENVENLIIEWMRRLDNRLSDIERNIHDEFSDVKQRLTKLERSVLGLRRESVEIEADLVETAHRHDSILARIERIEKRLDLSS